MARIGSTGSLINLPIDRGAPSPLYIQLISGFREAISQGQFPPGMRLPSTRTLASELSVSRNSIIHAFEVLREEGYLTSEVGNGTYVADVPPHLSLVSRHVAPKVRVRSGYPFRSLSQRGKLLLQEPIEVHMGYPKPFAMSVPDVRAFPMRTLLRIINESSDRLTGSALLQMENAGYRPFREAIAEHVRVSRGIRCAPEQTIITSGSQQSLDLICRVFLDEGDPVWVEDPGRLEVRHSVAGNGAKIVPIPVDGSGIDLEYAASKHPAPKMIIASPGRQFPLGTSTSPARRDALLRFIDQAGAWLVEDDYNVDFRYSGQSVPALQGMDNTRRVIYMSSFSKALLPSFRLGYVIVPDDLTAQVAKARSVIDLHAPVIEQMALCELIKYGHFSAHIRKMRHLYRLRQQTLLALLDEELSLEIKPSSLESGMHIVVPLPSHVDDVAITRTIEDDLFIQPLSRFYAGRDRPSGLIFGFAAFSEKEIERQRPHIKRLNELIELQLE